MNKRLKSVPDFSSEAEEHAFWETHASAAPTFVFDCRS